MRPAIEALGDDFDELVEILRPWDVSIRQAGGYLPKALTSSPGSRRGCVGRYGPAGVRLAF